MEFRLLVEVPNPSSRIPTLAIDLNGKQWQLTEPLSFNEISTIPTFTCVSYIWGDGRTPNPFQKGQLMSENTLIALASAMRHSTTSAFWVDAFCIPVERHRKRATLQSLGFIYHLAKEVVVALSGSTPETLKQLRESDRLDGEALQDLENDKWVESVWTFQEVINSQRYWFVSSNRPTIGSSNDWSGEDVVVDGAEFLNRIGFSFQLYMKAHHLGPADMRARFPRLDSLQDVIASSLTAEYFEPSAMQVMSNLDLRYCTEPEGYFFSMMGAITAEPLEREPGSTIGQLARTAMDIFEAKNDYSFIYSSNPRDQAPGKGWRPEPGFLHSILPWHITGERQQGYRDEQGFWLEGMLVLDRSERIGSSEREDLLHWIRTFRNQLTDSVAHPDAIIADKFFKILEELGFRSENYHILTDQGIFYPQTPPDSGSTVSVLTSTQIYWPWGAPGFAKTSEAGVVRYIPGVFVGRIRKELAHPVLL